MIRISDFIADFPDHFPGLASEAPWVATALLPDFLAALILQLKKDDYDVRNNVAVHRSAWVDPAAILKPPVIVGERCFVGANACLRGGVFMAQGVAVGMGCEIKTSAVMANSAIAHFNFVGDSLVGARVNMEAGAVVANHFNERAEKSIVVYINGAAYPTQVNKFGALIGDDVKIGANAVLSPGTLLLPRTVVKRLALIDQSVV